MRLKDNTLKPIHELTKIPLSKLSDYAATRCRPSRKTSLVLEQASGINKMIWLFGTEEEIKSKLNDNVDM